MAKKFDISVVIRLINGMSAPLATIGTSLNAVSAKTAMVSKSMLAMGKTMTTVGATLNRSLTMPIVGLGALAVYSFDKQAKAVEQVRVGIEATGGAAGRSLEQLTKMASKFQNETIFGDEEILGGVTSQLLTFTNIAGDNFDKTHQAILDVATRLSAAKGGAVDLTSTSIMLGKALNDPVANLGALSRSGIQFSKDQKEMIKQMVEGGKIADAQALILKELDRQYGGSAKAAAKAGAGGIKQLKNAVGDLLEVIGKLLADVLVPLAKSLIPIIQKWSEWISKMKESNPLLLKILGLSLLLLITLGPILTVVGKLSTGIGLLFKGFSLLTGVLPAVLPLLKMLFTVLGMGIKTMIGLFVKLTAVLLANPIMLVIAAIAAAAYLIYRNWEPIKKFFIELWETITKKFWEFWESIKNVFNKVAGFFKGIFGKNTKVKVESKEVPVKKSIQEAKQKANKDSNSQTSKVELTVKQEEGSDVGVSSIRSKGAALKVTKGTKASVQSVGSGAVQ